jgi:hypothetical protein
LFATNSHCRVRPVRERECRKTKRDTRKVPAAPKKEARSLGLAFTRGRKRRLISIPIGTRTRRNDLNPVWRPDLGGFDMTGLYKLYIYPTNKQI